MTGVKRHEWVEGFPGSIMVCDSAGIILELNKKAVESHRADGGKKLIGSNLMNCHPEPARSKLKQLMKKRQTNVYTVTKGRSKLIVVQAPWYSRKKYRGYVQISLKLSGRIPNHIRKP
ncbi:MAG: diguanylate cyclase [Candidatus Bathyarchaeia archaeon]